jgi:type VII secretion integral membrane protein EccD
MSASDTGLRRVSIHADGSTVDLALPATIPIGALIPSMVDLLGCTDQAGTRYRLSRLGAASLTNSTTLEQNDIRDGAVLVLTHQTLPPLSRRCDDDAEAVSATLGPVRRPSRLASRLTGAVAAGGFTAIGAMVLVRNAFSCNQQAEATAAVAAGAGVIALLSAAIAHRIFRDAIAGLALSLIATLFAAVTGMLVVPGVPGAPHVLLAAMAAAVTAVLALRVSYCGVATLTAAAGCAVIIAVAALAGVVSAAPPHVVGSLTALVCLFLLEIAPRISVLLAGLSPRLPAALDLDHTDTLPAEGDLATKAVRAEGWLTSLSAAFAVGAGLGATFAAFTARRAIALAAVTAALLLLRARTDRTRAQMFTISGTATTAAVFAIVAASAPNQGAWIAVLMVTLAAAAAYLGFVAPAISFSPVAGRGFEAVGCLALAAMMPLACWTCGTFSAVRGLIRI